MPSRRQNGSRHHASIYDYKDTDLLAKLASTSAEGITSHDLAEEMGWSDGEGANALGIRFAWMRRFGMVKYDEKTHLWTMTDGAERVMEAQRIAAKTKTIERIPDESMVEVMAHVTSRYRLGDPMMAALLRREFQYGTSPQSRVWTRSRTRSF